MRNRIFTKAIWLCLALLVAAGGGVAQAANGKPQFSHDEASIKSRLDNVRRLVTSSSGAKRVAESYDKAAQDLRKEATLFLERAESAFNGGNMAAASEALHTATEKMFGAIRQIGTGKAGRSKKNNDFNDKASSADVLLTAVERIAEEKGSAEVLPRVRTIRDEIAVAQQNAKEGRMSLARSRLDKAYDKAKTELERLRNGETLVRSLNFASKEEEYHYELDRNETHKMLLTVLLEDKSPSEQTRRKIDDFVGKSRTLRGTAEKEAGNGSFGQAVETLEQSTKHLQRAIRSAGVYIPG